MNAMASKPKGPAVFATALAIMLSVNIASGAAKNADESMQQQGQATAQSGRPSTVRSGKVPGPSTTRSPTYGQLISAGYELLRDSKPREAYVAAAEAARLDPSRFESYALAALVMHTRGDDHDAQDFVEQAVALAPPDKKARMRELAKEIYDAVPSSRKPAVAEQAANGGDREDRERKWIEGVCTEDLTAEQCSFIRRIIASKP